MIKTQRLFALIPTLALLASLSLAQGPSDSQFQVTTLLARARSQKRAGFALMSASRTAAASAPTSVSPSTLPVPNLPVFGNGSLGRLTKWTGFTSSSSAIGDSNIFEDKFGKVGIGTTSPTSLLTVQGVIETFGGIKFADGTTQTTSTAGALFGVAHDATLAGNGTTGSPLGVAVPFVLSATTTALLVPVLSVTNNGSNGIGVLGFSPDGRGVTGSSVSSIGVRGQSDTGPGVQGVSLSGTGVAGVSSHGAGVSGLGGTDSIGVGTSGVVASGGPGTISQGGDGVLATGGSSSILFGGDGIHAVAGAGFSPLTPGLAGRFTGNVQITGNLSATGTKMFKIDHPLDPENKYLYHAAIESSEVLNIYSGNITTDQNGEATVGLPEWFEALNKDFRYQLTVIGTFAQAIVGEQIEGNRFVIKSSAPNVMVSWQVTGVRSDAVMKKYPFKAEEGKAERERGYYLTPEVFDQPEEKSIEWARNPELMLKLKQQRLETEAKIKKQQPQ